MLVQMWESLFVSGGTKFIIIVLANSEVEQGNTGYSDVQSGLGREILPLKLERGWTTCIAVSMYGDYHCVCSSVRSLSVIPDKCLLASKGLLGFIWFSCVHLPFIYAIGTCPLFIAATTTAKPVWYSYSAQLRLIGTFECSTFKLSIYSPGFFWRQTNEPVMHWWCKCYKCWPVTHWTVGLFGGDDTGMVNETLF